MINRNRLPSSSTRFCDRENQPPISELCGYRSKSSREICFDTSFFLSALSGQVEAYPLGTFVKSYNRRRRTEHHVLSFIAGYITYRQATKDCYGVKELVNYCKHINVEAMYK